MSPIQASLSLVDGLDAALEGGLARLLPGQRDALAAFGSALAGSPLGGAVAEAVATIDTPLAHHLTALAAGRAAVLGAVHDALLAEAPFPLNVGEVDDAPAPTPTPEQRQRMDGLQQWLVEVALAGFGQLDAAMLTPVLANVAAVQGTPGLGRLAALATGFLHELLEAAPTSSLPSLPRQRWADLWTRCLLGTAVLPEALGQRAVAGRLHVLGAEPRHHDHLAAVVIHGVLEADGERRFTRTTLAAWKVDAIAGADVWNLLRPKAPALVAALAAPATLNITGRLSPTGALEVDEVGASAPYDPFALDLSGVVYAPPTPRDRHPVQLAVPVRGGLPVDDVRRSPLLEVELADAADVLGLARWDGAWTLQPLLVRTKKGKLLGPALAAADKVKSDARAVLSERASKLLRAKA
jgi:hypothetical protein